MQVVFEHYCDSLARYLDGGFTFASAGQTMRFTGADRRHELHDLIADSFRRAFEERARLGYEGLAPYDAYLKRIARNLVIDRLRHDRRLTIDADVADRAAEQRATATAEQLYQHSELDALMRDFIDALEGPLRRFVELRFERGLSQHDVARQLKRSRRWVRKTEQAVRAALVKHLDHTGYLPAPGGRAR